MLAAAGGFSRLTGEALRTRLALNTGLLAAKLGVGRGLPLTPRSQDIRLTRRSWLLALGPRLLDAWFKVNCGTTYT